MSLFKKVVSSVCALGMLSMMAVASVNVYAAECGMLKATLDYDQETGEGTVTVSLTEVSEILGNYDPGFATIASTWTTVELSDEDFDTSLYGNMPPMAPPYAQNIVRAGEWQGQMTPGPWNATTDAEVPGFVVGCAYALPNGQTQDTDLFTFNFKVKDTSKTNVIRLVDTYADVNVYRADIAQTVVETYGDANYGSTNTDNTIGTSSVTVEGSGDVEIVIPPATGVTATGGQLLNLKPSDIGLEGDEWTTEDPAYADEKAVVSLANVKKDDAITGFTWEIKATDAEGNPLEKTTEYFKAGNIESAAEVTVGLVVGYDTTEWQSVEIVGVTAE